jgi:DNA polymerase
LLTDIIEKGMKLSREKVYIANVLKCRPPENRTPTPAEAAICGPALEKQIEIIRPKAICALGAVAFRYLLNPPLSCSLGSARGAVHDYRGIPLIITYHPSYLLRNPASKKDCWNDIQRLLAIPIA